MSKFSIRWFLLTCGWLLLTCGWLLLLPATLPAQLPQDVRNVFEGLLDELDEDLQAKFQSAIDNETATVEFSVDQFKRFRDNPANPFEGLDRIKTGQIKGNIALKFELPSVRNRRIGIYERQSKIVLSQITDPIRSVAASTVKVFSKQRQVALGVIVDSDGLVLTKASEVTAQAEVTCELPDGTRHDVKIVRTDEVNDLALLKIGVSGLPTASFSSTPILPGAFLLTPNPDGSVVALGTYSHRPRSTAEGEQAFLGVQPEATDGGVRVSDIRRGSASYSAGMQDGDVITKLAGAAIRDVAELVKSIRDRRPGDQVEIELVRGGNPMTLKATLAGREIDGEQAARFKMMNRLGAFPSRRDDNFPCVFQHDTPLFPEQCGGPIADLQGNVVGLNIARLGRAASYALPSTQVKTALDDLLRETIASR